MNYSYNQLELVKEIIIAGNENSIGIFENDITALVDVLPAKEIIPQDYSRLPKVKVRV